MSKSKADPTPTTVRMPYDVEVDLIELGKAIASLGEVQHRVRAAESAVMALGSDIVGMQLAVRQVRDFALEKRRQLAEADKVIDRLRKERDHLLALTTPKKQPSAEKSRA